MTAPDAYGTGTTLLRPIPAPPAAGTALSGGGSIPLCGGPLRVSHVEPIRRNPAFGETAGSANQRGPILPVDAVTDPLRPALHRLAAPRPPLAGLSWERPRILGIVNVTPDSFSDGGQTLDPGAATARGLALTEAGADMIDVGGESTRPGAQPVDPLEEQRRVLPVIRALAGQGIRVSIDTRHADTMRAALDAGASVLNDVTALTGDADSLRVAAESGAPVILMHMQGEPQTMQQAPAYRDALLDVYDFLAARLADCIAAGIEPTQVMVDPGIGFGKTLTHNLEILRGIGLYHNLGCPVAVGVSRKRFIAALSRDEPPLDRVAGSLAAGLTALDQGVQLLRVHDVAQTAQALAFWHAIRFA